MDWNFKDVLIKVLGFLDATRFASSKNAGLSNPVYGFISDPEITFSSICFFGRSLLLMLNSSLLLDCYDSTVNK
jgi:hypothetical protein